MEIPNIHDFSKKVQNFLENPDFREGDFYKFKNLITNTEEINFLSGLLLSLRELVPDKENIEINKVNTKKFISLYLILLYPEINNVNIKIPICRDLINICKQLKFSLKNIIIFLNTNCILADNISENPKFKLGFLPIVNSFFTKYTQFLEIFEKWKQMDLEHLIFNLSLNYYQLDEKMKNLEQNENLMEFRMIYKLEKKKLKAHVRELDSQYGIAKFHEYLDIIKEFYSEDMNHNRDEFFFQKIAQTMQFNIKEIFWDSLEEEIEEEKYCKLEEAINDLKQKIKNCVPNKKEVHLELDEVLDANYIISQIQDKVFNKNRFSHLVWYVIGKLEEYQSESQDETTEELKLELESLLIFEEQDIYTFSFIIRFFLESCTMKFDSIAREREFILKLLKQNK